MSCSKEYKKRTYWTLCDTKTIKADAGRWYELRQLIICAHTFSRRHNSPHIYLINMTIHPNRKVDILPIAVQLQQNHTVVVFYLAQSRSVMVRLTYFFEKPSTSRASAMGGCFLFSIRLVCRADESWCGVLLFCCIGYDWWFMTVIVYQWDCRICEAVPSGRAVFCFYFFRNKNKIKNEDTVLAV